MDARGGEEVFEIGPFGAPKGCYFEIYLWGAKTPSVSADAARPSMRAMSSLPADKSSTLRCYLFSSVREFIKRAGRGRPCPREYPG